MLGSKSGQRRESYLGIRANQIRIRGSSTFEYPIQRLEGITYWVIIHSETIYDFINTNKRKEWGGDVRSVGRDPSSDPQLQSLSQFRWRLENLPIDLVKPDPKTMNYKDEKTE